jgi:hypothetical protein
MKRKSFLQELANGFCFAEKIAQELKKHLEVSAL